MAQISVDAIDRYLLKLLTTTGWHYLQEDFLEETLKRKFGVELKDWELATKSFYLYGTIIKGGRELRIWKPVRDPSYLLLSDV